MMEINSSKIYKRDFDIKTSISLILILISILGGITWLILGRCTLVYLKASKIEKLEDGEYRVEYKYGDKSEIAVAKEGDPELKGIRRRYYVGLDYFSYFQRENVIPKLLIGIGIIALIGWIVIFLKGVEEKVEIKDYISY